MATVKLPQIKLAWLNVFEIYHHSQETGNKEGNNQINTEIRIMISVLKKEHASLKQNNRVGENGVGKLPSSS